MLTDNNSNRVMEVDFILRNLFIFAPKPLSVRQTLPRDTNWGSLYAITPSKKE